MQTGPHPVAGLTLTLRTSVPPRANQPLYLSFDAVDAQGQLRSDDVQALSARQIRLDLVDEKLTTYLRPDFVNRHQLQFGVTFRSGKVQGLANVHLSQPAAAGGVCV